MVTSLIDTFFECRNWMSGGRKKPISIRRVVGQRESPGSVARILVATWTPSSNAASRVVTLERLEIAPPRLALPVQGAAPVDSDVFQPIAVDQAERN